MVGIDLVSPGGCGLPDRARRHRRSEPGDRGGASAAVKRPRRPRHRLQRGRHHAGGRARGPRLARSTGCSPSMCAAPSSSPRRRCPISATAAASSTSPPSLPISAAPASRSIARPRAAILSLTRSWARELAPRILVNAVAPGPDRHAAPRLRQSQPGDAGARDGATRSSASGGRRRSPRRSSILAGPGATFITGQCIGVDGGAAMH